MAARGNPNFKIFNSLAQFFSKNKLWVADMASRRLGERSGTKFCFRRLPKEPKIIIPDPFHEERHEERHPFHRWHDDTTTQQQLHDSTTLKHLKLVKPAPLCTQE